MGSFVMEKAIKKLAAFLKAVHSDLEDESSWVDIASWVRNHYNGLDMYELKEPFEKDIFTEGKQYFQALGVNLDSKTGWEPNWAEYDIVIVQINYSTVRDGIPYLNMGWEELAKYILIIKEWDCSGCCDAIEFMKMGRTNILVHVNAGRTYHS